MNPSGNRPPLRRDSPFKSTKRWNRLIDSFKEGMELKRRKWRLKSYESCFSGKEAMQWMYQYLQNDPMYGTHVTKQNTHMLLQKFMESKVFQGVTEGKNIDKFQDTNYLYRFVENSNAQLTSSKENIAVNKEDKENFYSRNSWSSLMRTISKRHSKSDLKSHENLASEEYRSPLKENGGNRLKPDTVRQPRLTPLAKTLDDMSLLCEKNYSKYSTVLFEPDEEDDVFETSISEQGLARCNSLQSYKRDSNQARQPLGTLWVNEYKKTELEYQKNLKVEKKTETKKMPRSFGKASLYNLAKNSRLGKRKSNSVTGSKSSSKLEKLDECTEEQSGRQRSYSLNQSTSRSLEKNISLSTVSQAGSQESLTSSFPPKALAILGEDPSLDTLINSSTDIDINSPVYKRPRTSPVKGVSENVFNLSREDALDEKIDIGSITNICCGKGTTWGSNNLELSYCNLLVNNTTMNYQDDLNTSTFSLTNEQLDTWNSDGLMKKANSISFLGPYPAEAEKKQSGKQIRRQLPSRSNAVRKSISQKSLRKTHSSQVANVQGYQFNPVNMDDENRLYKAPSSWSIDTIGLNTEQDSQRKSESEITVDDVEQTWKQVTFLSLKKLLGVDSMKTLLNCDLVHGANIMKNVQWNLSEVSDDAPAWLLSAMNCLIDWPNVSSDTEDSILQDTPSYPGFERDVYRAVKDHYHTTLRKPLIPEHFYPLVEKCSDILFENKAKAVKIMQHIILLLPCWNRRQLQLLVNFMSKVSVNCLLELSQELPTRDLVIHSFLQLITRQGDMLTVQMAAKPMRIVNLLMDSFDLVFKAPPNLRGQVDHKLAIILGKPATDSTDVALKEGLSGGNDSVSSAKGPQFYCQQITKAAYEEEAKDYQRAINDLLTTLITDRSFSEKERKKRLKQFQKAYPEIYNERFASHNISTCSSTINESTYNFRRASKPSFLREEIL